MDALKRYTIEALRVIRKKRKYQRFDDRVVGIEDLVGSREAV
jgi:hypothetical protein